MKMIINFDTVDYGKIKVRISDPFVGDGFAYFGHRESIVFKGRFESPDGVPFRITPLLDYLGNKTTVFLEVYRPFPIANAMPEGSYEH